MDKTTKNKWQVRLAALGIFLLGMLAGALIINLYNARYSTSAGSPGPGGWGRQPLWGVRNVAERLDLNPSQTEQVERILDDAREQLGEMRKQSEPRVREIRKQAEERLQQVLTEDQWRRFQELKKEMYERHRRGGRHHRG